MASDGQTFEYEQSDEADEGFSEASDEAFNEASDEAFNEASDEASDEAFEASDEASDEGFDEASDEAFTEASDESFTEASDEGLDEASATFSISANADARRRAEWQRKVETDQRADAQRAAATQRRLTRELRAVPNGTSARVQTVGPLSGTGVVTAVLPNGRQTRMRILPTPASIKEVNQLLQVVLTNERRQAAHSEANRRAIARLAKAQANAVTQLTAQQVKSDRDLSKRMVEGYNRLDKRISTEFGSGKGSLGKQRKRLMRILRNERRRSLMNNVLLATSLPFFTAYGDRANPFSRNNLILGGTLLGFLVGDEVINRFAPAGKSGHLWHRSANAWSYLAPVGFGASAWYLMKDKIHQRFTTGVVATTTANVNDNVLTVPIDVPKNAVEFQSAQTLHAAVATLVSASVGVSITSAKVTPPLTDGKATLTITLDGLGSGKSATVAYMVDMQPTT